MQIYTLKEGLKQLRTLQKWIILITFPLMLYACTGKEQNNTSGSLIFKDDLGREIVLSSYPDRIFAFAPSMTEMLFAVVDSSKIIARNPNDDYPKAALLKPIVSNYPVDFEQVLQLKPDLIFTIEGITPLDVAARLQELGIQVYYQKYNTVEDVLKGIEDIGKVTGHLEKAQYLADSLRLEIKKISNRHKNIKNPQKVLAITWRDPIYAYGQNTLLSDKFRILGAQNAVQEVFDQPYPALTREYILKLNPDVLLGDSPQAFEDKFFSLYPELKMINAYKNKRLYDPTGNLMERPSPRIVESILELEAFLYP